MRCHEVSWGVGCVRLRLYKGRHCIGRWSPVDIDLPLAGICVIRALGWFEVGKSVMRRVELRCG